MVEVTETPVAQNEIVLPETMVVPSKYCALMFNMIHVIAKRGGITADEFTVVGELMDFLKKELRVEEHMAAQRAAAAEASAQ
ncbi:hypothetical protein PGAG_00053 [Phaeocystis globosa virus 12T]|uniref:Uncharacterized protein n=1 Tax=Phaeocystis globosa virus PgV-16T TaxID=3071227 RepID=A0AC59EWQ9_9VIRU|nr:hypothetical protein PGCG_00093 [Phaeocystis globosa virus]AET72943.1 hypothetical protein PGAG_00053 [Phaeocystis globosa virus 12T]AET73761.1 hypothetical protein PGBG_00053 [Phaeocystis globosa virus 14T]AGM15405.1 hypothetical protein PGCG_00093 [Phaeocystis globosa virus PgV-16T]UYE94135.1 hypothetical protein PGV14T_00093 [Phaeocystis globosa virus]